MLSGLVIHQLKSPGAPLIVDTSVTFLDMSSMVPPYFAPEVLLASMMNREMALYYGVPTFAKAGAGDAKILDQQAGIEIGMTLYNEYLIGNNLIHDLGYLASGMTASLDSMVICDEVVGMVKRIGRGVELGPQQLALDAITAAGPNGNYLTQNHTLEHFRREFWFPRILDHGDYNTWTKNGCRSLGERAHQRARDILSSHRPAALEKEVDREIERILNQ
jgi:trimethylamine--corrinoid protein Co-methyltransferase